MMMIWKETVTNCNNVNKSIDSSNVDDLFDTRVWAQCSFPIHLSMTGFDNTCLKFITTSFINDILCLSIFVFKHVYI